MAQFCRDIDLVKWEPMLFRDWAPGAQTLCRGSGAVIADEVLSDEAGRFLSCQVQAGQVIYLRDEDGDLDGCYEIVEVTSETELRVSVVRSSDDAAAIGLGEFADVSYRVSTFDPQSGEAAQQLMRYFNLEENEDGLGVKLSDVQDVEVFRQASVFAVLAALLASCATEKNDSMLLWEKSHRYQQMYHTARTKIRVLVDLGQDGRIEQVKTGGSILLRRS